MVTAKTFIVSMSIFNIFCINPVSASDLLDPKQGIPMCPALNSGKRLILNPALDSVTFSSVNESEYQEERFLQASRIATNVLSYFENAVEYMKTGGQASYNGISKLDGLSIGQMQWNWRGGHGTLVNEFMVNLDRSYIAIAESDILQTHLHALYDFAKNSGSRQSAEKAVAYIAKSANDPQSDMGIWLNTPELQAHQNNLVKNRMGKTLKVTKTWMEQGEIPDVYFERIFVFFANLNIHAGLEPNLTGLRDVWIPQIKKFKSDLGNNKSEILTFITDWMFSCKPKTKLMKRHPDYSSLQTTIIAGGEDAFGEGPPSRGPNYHVGNGHKWSTNTIAANMDDVELDLFVYAFLFSTRSNTNDDGKKIPGWIQLDALNRAGFIALRYGMSRQQSLGWEKLFGD